MKNITKILLALMLGASVVCASVACSTEPKDDVAEQDVEENVDENVEEPAEEPVEEPVEEPADNSEENPYRIYMEESESDKWSERENVYGEFNFGMSMDEVIASIGKEPATINTELEYFGVGDDYDVEDTTILGDINIKTSTFAFREDKLYHIEMLSDEINFEKAQEFFKTLEDLYGSYDSYDEAFDYYTWNVTPSFSVRVMLCFNDNFLDEGMGYFQLFLGDSSI